jgi:hypothetical protein
LQSNIISACLAHRGKAAPTLELKNMELRGNDGVWAAGNYSVTVKDKPIQGNWFRILKRENGSWKIAMEAFARAGVIDALPAATVPHHRQLRANRAAIDRRNYIIAIRRDEAKCGKLHKAGTLMMFHLEHIQRCPGKSNVPFRLLHHG